MTRWIAAAGVAAVIGSTGVAKPPVEAIPQGKERTQIERDLYLSEPPAQTVTAMKLTRPSPEPEPNPFESLWAAAVRFTYMPLGTVPLVPREKW
ncbi:MAG: hypothetical protein ABGY75_06345 [Gemmataceae bacterium]